jgi:hypothetical protein
MFSAQPVRAYSLRSAHNKFGFQADFKETYNLLNSTKFILIFLNFIYKLLDFLANCAGNKTFSNKRYVRIVQSNGRHC